VTGHGNRWTRERVTALRSHHKIPGFRPAPDGNEPWLNLNKAAGLLGIAPKTLRLAAEAGEIKGGSSSAGWSVDLQPINARRTGGSARRSSREAEPTSPHGIASRSAKPLLFNRIDGRSRKSEADGEDAARRPRQHGPGNRVGLSRSPFHNTRSATAIAARSADPECPSPEGGG
jgi:hypothetical protein